jgi:hypothetical protein
MRWQCILQCLQQLRRLAARAAAPVTTGWWKFRPSDSADTASESTQAGVWCMGESIAVMCSQHRCNVHHMVTAAVAGKARCHHVQGKWMHEGWVRAQQLLKGMCMCIASREFVCPGARSLNKLRSVLQLLTF